MNFFKSILNRILRIKDDEEKMSLSDFINILIDELDKRVSDFTLLSVNESSIDYQIGDYEFCSDFLNAFIEFQPSTDNLNRTINELVNSIVEISSTDFKIKSELIYPILRCSNLDESYIVENISKGLNMYYGLDSKYNITYLSKEMLKHNNLLSGSLKIQAFENLKQLLNRIKIINNKSIFMITNAHGYESSLCLLDDFWRMIRHRMNNKNLVFTIPNRDLLLITDTSKENMIRLKEIAKESYTNGSYPIIPNLYEISKTGELIGVNLTLVR